MKVIDVFYSESKNISCISVRYRGIKAGQKITDENDNLYEVYGLNTNGRAFLVIKKHQFLDAKVKLLYFLRIFLELVIE